MATRSKSLFPLLVGFSFALQLLAIGVMFYGIKTDRQLVTAGVPILVAGISLLVVAIALRQKQKQKQQK